MKKIVIIGAGPAGITAGYELAKQKKKYEVTIIEAENIIGGLAKTITHAENYMDLGGHRFYSKNKRVNDWWRKILPLQSKPAVDYYKTNRSISLPFKGPNPYTNDKVLLKRKFFARIFDKQKFYSYPPKFRLKSAVKSGLGNILLCAFDCFGKIFKKKEEKSLEDYYINRYGRFLYKIFFESYAEKVWGKHPSLLSAKIVLPKIQLVEKCKSSDFFYPKYGSGQMWETAAEDFVSFGGKLLKNARVVELRFQENKITYVGYKINEKLHFIKADYLISTMPLGDLVSAFNTEVPENIRKTAKGLAYRDIIVVGIMVKQLKVENKTNISTLNNLIPDNCLYIHDKGIKLAKLQILNNWSPYLMKRNRHNHNNVWLELEYFCSSDDADWLLNKQHWRQVAVADLLNSGIIRNKKDVITYCVKKVQKAYPLNNITHSEMNELQEYLTCIENLFCIGRNGRHRCCNMDQTMMSSFAAVDCINGKRTLKHQIWPADNN